MALLPDTVGGYQPQGLARGAAVGVEIAKAKQAQEQQKRSQYLDQYKAQKDQSMNMVTSMKKQIDNDYLLKKKQVEGLKIEDPAKQTEMLNALEAKYRTNLSEWEKTRTGIYGSLQQSIVDPMVQLGYLPQNQADLDQKQFMSISPLRQDEQAYIDALSPAEEARAETFAKAEVGQDVATFYNPDSGEVVNVPVTDPSFDTKRQQAEGQGFIRAKTPSIDITGGAKDVGLTTSQKGKEQLENIELEKAVRRNVLASENIINLVSSNEYVGGLAGDAVSLANSFSAQVRQLTGMDSIFKDGELDESQLDVSSDKLSRFRKAAVAGDRTDAAILDLSYILAKMRDPAGRISDKDIEASEKTLRSGADKLSIINLLRDNQKRGIQMYNSDIQVMNKRLKRNYQPLKLDEILGGEAVGGTETDKDISNRLLKDLESRFNK